MIPLDEAPPGSVGQATPSQDDGGEISWRSRQPGRSRPVAASAPDLSRLPKAGRPGPEARASTARQSARLGHGPLTMADEAPATATIYNATVTKTLPGRQDDGSRGAGSERQPDQSEILRAAQAAQKSSAPPLPRQRPLTGFRPSWVFKPRPGRRPHPSLAPATSPSCQALALLVEKDARPAPAAPRQKGHQSNAGKPSIRQASRSNLTQTNPAVLASVRTLSSSGGTSSLNGVVGLQ